MREIPVALAPVVESAANSPVELYELYLDFGTRYLAASDSDITFNGIEYKALGIRRQPITTHLSGQVDQVSVSLNNVNTVLSQLLANTEFRGRRCRVLKVFRESLTVSTHFVCLFDGRMDQPAISEDGVFTLRIVSYLDVLHKDYPGRIFSTQCNYKLGNEWCGVDMEAAENKVSGTILTGSSTRVLIASALSQATDYWKSGRVKFLTGLNRGMSREVLSSTTSGTFLTLRLAFPFAPAIGDTFEVLRGCAKTEADCADKFDNWLNYGGFNTTPKPSHPIAWLGGGGGGGKGGDGVGKK